MFIKFLSAAVFAGTPLLFGTTGEIMNEKAGHLNLGVEGMMAMGACAGFMAGFFYDSIYIALLAAFLAGMLGALIYALLTITLMANQNVTGLTLSIFGVGICNFVGEFMLLNSPSNTLKLPEHITAQISNLNIPGLSTVPVFGPLLFQYNIFVYLAALIALICGIYYNHTKTGLNVRAIGENPGAADAAGIKVTKLKYINLLAGGGICGLGGAYCSMIINGGVWMNNPVNGQGWIAVALVIFASWKPYRAIFGSFIFGAFSILKYYFPKTIISLPNAFYDMLPFIITALVLVITSVRKSKENQQPASCGVNYYREER